MIGLVVAIALMIRWLTRPQVLFQGLVTSAVAWDSRWHRALTAFVMPPLLLLTTAVAIVTMGAGSCHAWEGLLTYAISLTFLSIAVGLWGQLVWRVHKMRQQVFHCPQRIVQADSHADAPRALGTVLAKVLAVPEIFSAQIGLWSSDLVVSDGLLRQLDEAHLEAVLAHEAGHAYYRDTFWFFWLGGLRRLTAWLPDSEALWQELLLLREIRADKWAAQRVDPLVLAESLVSVISAPLMPTEAVCASFSCAAPRSRLAQRVEALLSEGTVDETAAVGGVVPWKRSLILLSGPWVGVAVAMTPLLTIPFHH
ncbi:MAG: M56 family metallopeptidase [Cyanobacteria bacterium J06598_3]